MALASHHKTNLATLKRAADEGALAVLECRRRSDGETVALLVAVGQDAGEYTFTPFAEMVNGNPFELYDPPDPDGGFYEAGS